MRKRINNTIFAAICIAALSIGFASCTKQEQAAKSNAVPALDPKNMDTTIAPETDFFRYANGNWMKNNPIPAEYSRWGAFNELQETNNENLKTIMESAAKIKNAAKGTPDQLIGDFFASGMDSAKIDQLGAEPIMPELKLIDAAANINDIQNAVAHLHTIGVYPLFGLFSGQDEKNSDMVIAQLWQGGLGMGDRDYYVLDDPRSKDLREKYVIHVGKMFELLKTDKAVSEANAKIIMDIETKLAKASMTLLDMRDPNKIYNKMNIEGLSKLSPKFDWKQYFANIGLNEPGEFNVGQVNFFKQLSSILNEVPVENWKIYLKWNVVNSMADYLSSDFVNQNFDFFGKTFSGSEKLLPRWKRVLGTTNSALGEEVGKLYVKQFFPPEAKQKMITLVENLRKALSERIAGLTWMTAPTKEKAQEKLAAMKVKIGYPDKWRDYSKLNISRDNYLANIFNSNKFDFAYTLGKINKPVDRAEWHMTPQTVNAYYSPNSNEIVFPAAILQHPFFNKDADDPINYGGIGAVIGHEMTHGFDDQGRLYDKNGNLNDWWTTEDAENFKKQTQPLIDQYNQYVVIDGLTVNGELTIGENIADLGGITVAYVALQKALNGKKSNDLIDGFTPLQRFLLSWAQVWRSNIRPEEQKRRLREDVHSPAEARVNQIMKNIPMFYEAFKISETAKQYLKPELRAVIW